MKSGLSIEEHRVAVSKMSVNELHLDLRVAAGDQERLSHGLTRDWVEGRNVDSFAVLVLNAHGTYCITFKIFYVGLK